MQYILTYYIYSSSHRDEPCPSNARKGSCQWSGPLNRLADHLQRTPACCNLWTPHPTSPNDSYGEKVVEFAFLVAEDINNSNTYSTNGPCRSWKPQMCLPSGSEVIDACVPYIEIKRHPRLARWTITPYAMAGQQECDRMYMDIRVESPNQNGPSGGMLYHYRGNVNRSSRTNQEACRSGRTLALTDDQVRKLQWFRKLMSVYVTIVYFPPDVPINLGSIFRSYMRLHLDAEGAQQDPSRWGQQWLTNDINQEDVETASLAQLENVDRVIDNDRVFIRQRLTSVIVFDLDANANIGNV